MAHEVPKTIWIIGAGSGIGRSLAIELSKAGHRLLLSGRRVDKLQQLQATFIPNASIYPLDVTMPSNILDVFQKIISDHGVLDSVIMMSAQYEPMTLDQLDDVKCSEIVQTNLSATFSVLSRIVPFMKACKTGQIVFCGSVAGYKGLPEAQPYSATKAAIINLAESCRIDLAPWGIDVKVINPGFVRTDMTSKNKFQMPLMMDVDDAAKVIAGKIFDPRLFEIRTHRLFSFIMKCVGFMPYWMYFRVLRKKS